MSYNHDIDDKWIDELVAKINALEDRIEILEVRKCPEPQYVPPPVYGPIPCDLGVLTKKGENLAILITKFQSRLGFKPLPEVEGDNDEE